MSDFEALWQAANAGDPAQQFALGRHYADEADYGRSRRWLGRAARNGYHEARVELGRQSLLGLGIAASTADALDAFRRAAEAGDPNGQFELASALYRGQGLSRDTGAAAALLTEAARSGLPAALLNYALIVDQAGAAELGAELLASSAAGGDARARALLGQAPPAEAAARRWESLEALSLEPAALATPQVPDPAFSLRVYPELLTPLECGYLIETARPDLLPSHTVHPVTGESVLDTTRTSYGWSFHPAQEDIVITRVKERLALQAGFPFDHAEPFAMLRYTAGQEYREHFDYIDPESGEAGEEISRRGQRVATTFSYLSTPQAGGETEFPRFQSRVKPVAGTAVFFRNTLSDGSIDRNSLHASAPVVDGEKWLATLWFRDRPFRHE